MEVEEAKRIIREDPGGSILARLEAIEVAERSMGEVRSPGDLYRWAEKEDEHEKVDSGTIH